MNVQEGAIGVDIIVNALMPINNATVHDIQIKSSDGIVRMLPGTLVTDGSDGLIRYTTMAGDLTPPGIWKVQSYVVTPTINSLGQVARFTVLKNLQPLVAGS